MNNVVVQIPDRWQRFANSRLLVVVTALNCLSLSFGPVFLFQLAKAGVPYTDSRVIFCFASIVLLPLVYLRLAAVCIKQLRTTHEGG